MSQSYLAIAKEGKNSWWRYLIGMLLILFFWVIVGILLELSLESGFLSELLDILVYSHAAKEYVTHNISFIFLCLGIFIAVKWLHKRQFHTLISTDGSVNFKRFLLGFGVWVLLRTIFLVRGLLLNPQAFSFTFDSSEWFLLLPLALIFTPIQTSGEEFFHRGYLLQGLGCITRQPLVLIFVTSLLFAIIHFANPEMQRDEVWMALNYFAFGVFMSTITLKDNRLELALGVHAAHNLFSILIVSTRDSALPTNAIWIVEPGDPKLGLVFSLVRMAVFYYVFFGKPRKSIFQVKKSGK